MSNYIYVSLEGTSLQPGTCSSLHQPLSFSEGESPKKVIGNGLELIDGDVGDLFVPLIRNDSGKPLLVQINFNINCKALESCSKHPSSVTFYLVYANKLGVSEISGARANVSLNKCFESSGSISAIVDLKEDDVLSIFHTTNCERDTPYTINSLTWTVTEIPGL